MAEERLSMETHLGMFIKQIAVEQDFIINSTTITVRSLRTGEDYPQFKFQIKISQGERELNLFAKVTELERNNWESLVLKPFEKERLFYMTLMKTYRQLEEKHGLAEKDKLRLPVFYGADKAYNREILVLEDLASKGFGNANRFEPPTWEYAAAAMTELAKFQALSVAFKRESPDEFKKFTAQTPEGLFEKNEETRRLIESMTSIALRAVRNENERKLKAFLKSRDFIETVNHLLKAGDHEIIVHAHFWPKNMMHKILDDGTVEVIPVDYSTIQAGSPVTDFLHFIFTGCDHDFRAKYFKQLNDHYCAELVSAVERLGGKPEFTTDDLKSEIMERIPLGLYAALIFLPALALDDRSDRPGPGANGNQPGPGANANQPGPGANANQPGPGANGSWSGPADDPDFASVKLYGDRLNQIVDEYVSAQVIEDVGSDKSCGMCFLC